jgi:hypothetical protein
MVSKHVAGLALIAVMGFGMSSAMAAPTYCNAYAPAANPDGLKKSDVTYSVTGAAPFSNSNDCYGVVIGNVNGASDVQGVWGSGWVLGDGTDTSSGTASLFGGSFTFTLAGPAGGATSGTYTLSATDNNGAAAPNFPIALDFLVAVKASDRYALYLFDDVAFDGSGGGSWSINYLNNGNQIPGLSHLQVYVREGASDRCPDCTPTPQGDLPEPASLALVGLALAASAGAARRRRRD